MRSLGPIPGGDDFGLTPGDFPSPFNGVVLSGSLHGSGARTFGARAVVTENTYPGDLIQAFSADFYGRVHYSFTLKDFGNVVGLQAAELSVWNAFLRAERLNSITPSNDDGVTMTGGPSLPFTFNPLAEAVYTFTVTPQGAANLDASYAFDWQTVDGLVRLVGVRVTAWSFRPDWTSGIVERLEWKTDILQSFNAKEQRRALRLAPRKSYEFDAFFTGDERRYAESTIWGWGARVWALPIWPDGQQLVADLAAGSTSISLDTTTRDFAAGSLVMLIADALTFETIEVEEVFPDSLTLARPSVQTWPAGTMVFPGRTARLAQAADLDRWDGEGSGVRASFNLDEPVDWPADAGDTLYRGLPVLTRRPDWTGGFSLELSRKLAELDALTGPRVYDDEAGIPLGLQRVRWGLFSRADQAEFRSLIYALRGRQGGAWLPTWANDLRVVATISNSATAIDVAFCAYTRMIAQGTGRRDIRIELIDGTVFYRRIGSSSVLPSGDERLVIDAALGVTVSPDQIATVSFMALCRLDSDAVELAFWTGEAAECATVFRGYQHDL